MCWWTWSAVVVNGRMKWLSLQYNAVAGVAVSVDTSHMVEYWCGPKHDYQFPKNLQWEFKTDTDLFDFLKASCPMDCFSLPLSLWKPFFKFSFFFSSYCLRYSGPKRLCNERYHCRCWAGVHPVGEHWGFRLTFLLIIFIYHYSLLSSRLTAVSYTHLTLPTKVNV